MACLARVQKAIMIAGVGSRQGLTLSYDALCITMFMACLTRAMQQDIYREFKRWDLTLNEMEHFARIMTTSNSLKSGQHKVAAISSNKQKAASKKTWN